LPTTRHAATLMCGPWRKAAGMDTACS